MRRANNHLKMGEWAVSILSAIDAGRRAGIHPHNSMTDLDMARFFEFHLATC